jgi:hypothetical protein
MRSKEFIRDSALDDMVAQVKQPKTPPPGAPIDDIIDQAGADTQDAKLSTAGLKAATGFMQGLKQGGKVSGNGGIHQSSYGKTPQQQQQQVAYQAGQTNPQIGQYLKSAAGNQPLKQATGNKGIDDILKAVGLLK